MLWSENSAKRAQPRRQFEISLFPDRPNYKHRCSCCGETGHVNEKLPERLWDCVPLWNIAVYLVDAQHRVICPVSGKPTVEAMP